MKFCLLSFHLKKKLLKIPKYFSTLYFVLQFDGEREDKVRLQLLIPAVFLFLEEIYAF